MPKKRPSQRGERYNQRQARGGRPQGSTRYLTDPTDGEDGLTRNRLATKHGIHYQTLKRRLDGGMSLLEALSVERRQGRKPGRTATLRPSRISPEGLTAAQALDAGLIEVDPFDRSLSCSQRYEAQAAAGLVKTCDTCGETKPINRRHFAPAAASDDAVHGTCRQCQNKAATDRQYGRAEKDPAVSWSEKNRLFPVPPEPWYNPDRSGYWDTIREHRDRLIQQTGTAQERKASLQLLTAATRLYDAPANWQHIEGTKRQQHGQQKDPILCFLTWIVVMEPLIQDYRELGEIHYDAIIPALFSDHSHVLLLASRNSAKSTLAQLWVGWLLWQDHYLTVQVFSRSDNAAKRFVRVVRNFLRHPLCWAICPDNDEHVEASQIIDGAFGFMLPPAIGHLGASLSLLCSGITSTGITGSRAHLVVLDDIESSADGSSDTRREQLLERTEEVDHLLHPKTQERVMSNKVVALGTPQVGYGRSIYAQWLKRGATIEDWDKTDSKRRAGLWQVFTARMFREMEEQNPNTGTRITRLESLWRDRFTEDDLEAKRSRMTQRNWNLHWRIDLGLDDDINDRPLRWSDAIVLDWPEDKLLFPRQISHGGERLKHLGPFEALGSNDGLFGPRTYSVETSAFVATICTVDPSSGMKNRDATGLCFLGVTATGVAVVRRLVGVRGESANDTLLNTAAEIARLKPTRVVVEATAQSLYPGSLETALSRQGFRTRVEATSARKNKADRIGDALGAALASNKLVFLESVFQTDCAPDVVHQLADFSYSLKYLDHDDIIDALAWSLIVAQEDRLFRADEAEAFDTFTQERREELLRLSPRQGGIIEGSPEDELFFGNHQEEMELTTRRLALALEDQQRLLKYRGREDATLARYIEKLRAEIKQFETSVHHRSERTVRV